MKDLCQKWKAKLIFRGTWNNLMPWPEWPWPPYFTTDVRHSKLTVRQRPSDCWLHCAASRQLPYTPLGLNPSMSFVENHSYTIKTRCHCVPAKLSVIMTQLLMCTYRRTARSSELSECWIHRARKSSIRSRTAVRLASVSSSSPETTRFHFSLLNLRLLRHGRIISERPPMSMWI